MTDELWIYQRLMFEHHNDPQAALIDLCSRFVRVSNGMSHGFLRLEPDFPAIAKVDDPPNPITDEWIATGVDA